MDPTQILTAIVFVLAMIGYNACLVRQFWVTVVLTLCIGVYIAALVPVDGGTLQYWLATAVCIVAAWAVAVWIRSKSGQSPRTQTKNRIIVDGTNVIFWNANTPQLETLQQVVNELRRLGFVPNIFLDASTRHHLRDKSLNEQGFAHVLGLSTDQVMVCPAGTEADAFILKFAKDEQLPILSNDRFSDRADLAKGIKIIKGVIVDGKPVFQGLQPLS